MLEVTRAERVDDIGNDPAELDDRRKGRKGFIGREVDGRDGVFDHVDLELLRSRENGFFVVELDLCDESGAFVCQGVGECPELNYFYLNVAYFIIVGFDFRNGCSYNFFGEVAWDK